MGTIISFLRGIFTRNKATIAGSLSGVFSKATATIPSIPRRVDLGTANIKQATLQNENAHYACNVTSHMMMGITLGAPVITLDAYYQKCLDLGAIRPDCWILDYNKMIKASGLVGYKFESCPVNIEKMINLLCNGLPMHLFAENHFEMVRGYEYTPQGELLFLMNDPGYQNDTHLETTTWKLFRFAPDGTRIYSVKGKDGPRYAKSIGYYVKVK